MNAIVVPALIPRSITDISATIELAKRFTSEIQIDVVDGEFVNSVSWPYGGGDMSGDPNQLGVLGEKIGIEFDLMVLNPHIEVERFLAAKPARIIVHADARPDVATLSVRIRNAGARFGFACSNDTPLEVFLDDLTHADYAQCMGITPVGAQGRPFDPRTIERVRAVRERFPEMEIAVDGSVNKDTIPLLREAGATRFACGSAILGATDPADAYRELTELASRG